MPCSYYHPCPVAPPTGDRSHSACNRSGKALQRIKCICVAGLPSRPERWPLDEVTRAQTESEGRAAGSDSTEGRRGGRSGRGKKSSAKKVQKYSFAEKFVPRRRKSKKSFAVFGHLSFFSRKKVKKFVFPVKNLEYGSFPEPPP